MAKPIIGIVAERWSSSTARLNRRVQGQLDTYVDAVLGAGGLPVLLPLLPDEADQDRLFEQVQGLILPGGGDLDPLHYLSPPHPATNSVDADRDVIELHLARRALDGDKPVLGICRGLQVLNVAAGGTLFQDLPTEFVDSAPHYFHYPEYPLDYLAHPVQVTEDSRFAGVVGQPILEVNSRHHQATCRVAPGLTVVGVAPDGVVEAVEKPEHPFALAVQWHPENLQARPEMKAIFDRLVAAARRNG